MSKLGDRFIRRGMAMIAVLACLLVASVFALATARSHVVLMRHERLSLNRQQAEWLAESALDRAVARLDADVDYAGETWVVSADAMGRDGEPGSDDRGEATITVDREMSGVGAVRVESRFPSDGPWSASARRFVRKTLVRANP